MSNAKREATDWDEQAPFPRRQSAQYQAEGLETIISKQFGKIEQRSNGDWETQKIKTSNKKGRQCPRHTAALSLFLS
jgi:hypothetical protein